jgi:hypothetical protein
MPFPFNADRATLFFDAAASRAVLVSSRRGRQHRRNRKFSDAVAALRWCLDTRTHFVLFWPSAAQSN